MILCRKAEQTPLSGMGPVKLRTNAAEGKAFGKMPGAAAAGGFMERAAALADKNGTGNAYGSQEGLPASGRSYSRLIPFMSRLQQMAAISSGGCGEG